MKFGFENLIPKKENGKEWAEVKQLAESLNLTLRLVGKDEKCRLRLPGIAGDEILFAWENSDPEYVRKFLMKIKSEKEDKDTVETEIHNTEEAEEHVIDSENTQENK